MEAVENLRKYLKIPTVHPDINYEPVLDLLKQIANDLKLSVGVYQYVAGNPIIVLTWIGTHPSLKSVLLNSHMDTVPVIKENWVYDPFGGVVDAEGNIHGRGAQDCKSVGLMYLEAIRRLKNAGVRLQRTVHVLFVPDEELGGNKGMGVFVNTDDFRALNVGFAIDEGFANADNKFTISYSDRLSWKFVVDCEGTTGHASFLLNDTPGEKLTYFLNKVYELRDESKQKLKQDPSLSLSDVISANLTQLQGGYTSNVIPEKLTLVFDFRLPPTTDLAKFEESISRWCEEAGTGVTIRFLSKNQPYATKLDKSNQFWVAFENGIQELQVPYEIIVYKATTDAYHLRRVGVPCIGFVPLRNTVPLKHSDNEYLNTNAFLEAIDFYTKLIPALGNC
ncbi:hypothetical protein RN001_010760 [Aquatica leii]|uniref:N-acyl-aliphatic-L-amino acid amidohydrolase n=1 Tax=Aquatica leii TaxID=1421715 RepID=A0AAN7PV80_9COLE|nr:hypothetical protein RN001_010760 [Aquatica leii]